LRLNELTDGELRIFRGRAQILSSSVILFLLPMQPSMKHDCSHCKQSCHCRTAAVSLYRPTYHANNISVPCWVLTTTLSESENVKDRWRIAKQLIECIPLYRLMFSDIGYLQGDCRRRSR